MPGIPRSTACLNCKKCRTRCSQDWPACMQCRRKKLVCQGPTSLVKFVAYKGAPSPGQGTSSSEEESPEKDKQASYYDDNLGSHAKTARDGDSRSFKKVDHSAYLRRLGLRASRPGKKLSLPGESSASRLVYHLDSIEGEHVTTFLPYLKKVPQRLLESPSLQACTNLFCVAWSSSCRGESLGEFIAHPAYGKAVIALRKTLAQPSRKGYNVETLTSMATLMLVEQLFDPSDERRIFHQKGLESLVTELGPPDPDDELYNSIFFEIYKALRIYWAKSGGKNFMHESPWYDIMKSNVANLLDASITEKEKQDELKPIVMSGMEISAWIADETPRRLREFQSSQTDPTDPSTKEAVNGAIGYLNRAEQVLEGIVDRLLVKCFDLDLGWVQNTPGWVTGKSYYFSNFFLAHTLVLLIFHLIDVSQARSGLSKKFDLPEKDEHLKRHREYCVRLWRYIPFHLSLDLFITSTIVPVTLYTVRFANELEKELLMLAINELDRSPKRKPLDKNKVQDSQQSGILRFGSILYKL